MPGKHEAHEFTPWLAENIEHLSEAIGIPLELTHRGRRRNFLRRHPGPKPDGRHLVLIEPA
ncbi:MAG: hypothetical protein R3D59_15475 [Paracoccaceae bacterium]